MNLVKNFTYINLQKTLLGKKARFKSDCQLFPNFNVTGKVIGITLINGIPLLKTILTNGKTISIDGGMSNLSFELL